MESQTVEHKKSFGKLRVEDLERNDYVSPLRNRLLAAPPNHPPNYSGYRS